MNTANEDPCDEHATALEMRRHGALPAGMAAALGVHLASCASCRALDAAAARQVAALAATGRAVSARADWPAIEARLHKRIRSYGRMTAFVPIALLAVAHQGYALLFSPHHRPVEQAMRLAVVVTGAAVLPFIWRRARDAQGAARLSGEALFAFHLAFERERLAHMRWLLPLSWAGAMGLLAMAWHFAPPSRRDPLLALAVVVFTTALCAGPLVWRARRLRRLREATSRKERL